MLFFPVSARSLRLQVWTQRKSALKKMLCTKNSALERHFCSISVNTLKKQTNNKQNMIMLEVQCNSRPATIMTKTVHKVSVTSCLQVAFFPLCYKKKMASQICRCLVRVGLFLTLWQELPSLQRERDINLLKLVAWMHHSNFLHQSLFICYKCNDQPLFWRRNYFYDLDLWLWSKAPQHLINRHWDEIALSTVSSF